MTVPTVKIIDAEAFEKHCSDVWLGQMRSLRDTLRKNGVGDDLMQDSA